MLAQTLWFTFQASLSNCSSELILFSQNRKINWKSTSLNFECHIVCSCNINQFLSLLLCIKTKLFKGKNLNCTRSLLDSFLKRRLNLNSMSMVLSCGQNSNFQQFFTTFDRQTLLLISNFQQFHKVSYRKLNAYPSISRSRLSTASKLKMKQQLASTASGS